ncbi:glycerol-3-phosphate dehydrogenase [Novosphingobium guangzhouense]|uniref:Glycerol-3-phosphate dehydrogenase n=1 Tax=Novosphingobium guangzhouense TaxID=1850347 RepID=A0A2K2FV22_9SPHN|nr:glycerol-3-phosphate dehydrogenase [Novosphingobium guangzhouense]PNU02626.1 glycerol-3-phosphate dehydrogenase [Novosphingobium guangzhouense]
MSDTYDIAIIGGGVNGCGIARDAAGRGAKVLVLEQGDLAGGTSSASTKLIHGGLRYLEHYEFALVREALTERERLWKIAPHIIHPMRFVLPHVKGLRPRWLLRLGLFLYDHIGGRKALPATESIDLRKHPAGRPLKSGFGRAFVYSDGWVDDARLVVLNARDAADRGATILTRTRVEKLEREGGVWTIQTSGGTFRAKAVVNAAGPSVLDLVGRAGEHTKRAMRLVRGSHIVVPRLFDHPYAYFFQISDGRIFFAIPYQHDFTLIGTTDRDHKGPLNEVKASDEEIAYLCDAANAYFERAITPADVVWTYSGVRPLVDDGSGKPEAATRGYDFDVDCDAKGEAPFLSVFGGKITTYRHLAKDAVEKLQSYVPALGGEDWTASASLPGGDFAMGAIEGLKADLAREYPRLDAASVDRVARAYGTKARVWLTADPGEDFGHGLTGAEVDYLKANEWARTSDDVLWRRTKLGLRLDGAQVQRLKTYMGE